MARAQRLLSPAAELEAASQLRQRTMDELEARRAELEWALEAPFDVYVAGMRRPASWGGELELLLSAHVLRRPLGVVLAETQRLLALYGEEYDALPIAVLYHGAGHYEALVPADTERPSLL